MGTSISIGTGAARRLNADGAVRIETVIDIDRPPREVFDFVTSPSLWYKWHPATSSTEAVPNRPIILGETVRENIRVGIKHFSTTWTVVECEPPKSWAIETDSGEGSSVIRYELTPNGTGTHFKRVLEYRARSWPWRWLDGWVMRWVLTRQSRRALLQLKNAANLRSLT